MWTLQRKLLRFLELSGVGRVTEQGVDEEEAHATRLDGWIIRETEEREPLGGQLDYLFLTGLFIVKYLVKGDSYPEFAHSTPLRVEDFLCFIYLS
jgi:hypothetical protein